MMRGWVLKFILFLLPLAGTTPGLLAQSQISGVVTDSRDGRPLQDAAVTLEPGHRGTYTDDAGEFRFGDVPPGKYRLKISRVGYVSVTKHIMLQKEAHPVLTIQLEKEVLPIGEVSVVGESAEKRIQRDLTIEPVSLKPAVTTITHEKMEEEGAVTLVEALRYVPGGLTETRGRKVKQFFSVRGQTYPYPTYSIDGALQKEFYETASFVNASNISAIRIDRSASSLLKSLSPLTGVIDIVTRRYTHKTTEAHVAYGSLHTFDAGVLHGNKTGRVEYSSGVDFFGTNGPAPRNGRERIVNANGTFRWQMNKKVHTSLKMFYLGGLRELVQPVPPAAGKFRAQKEKYDPLSTLLVLSKTKYKASEKLSGELQINYAFRNPKYILENLATEKITSYREKDRELTINHLNAWTLSPANIMRFGVLYNHWTAPNGKRYYWGHPADVHTWSAVVTDQQHLGKWLVNGGMRISQEYYKEWSAFSLEGSGKYFAGVEPIQNQWQPPVWQAIAGFTFAPGSAVSLHGNVAAGVVTPRKGALTADGSPPLNEKRTNLDLGVIRRCEDKGTLTVSLFFVSRNDAIDYTGETVTTESGLVVELYGNTDKRSYGMEGTMQRQIIPGRWEVFANILLMRGEEKDSTAWKKNDEIPVFIGNMGTTFRQEGFDVSFYMNYTGPFKNNRFVSKSYLQEHGKAPLGDFFDLTLTTGYSVGKMRNIRFFAEGHNLLDQHYQTVPGWPDNGRTFRGGITVKF